MLFYIHSLIYLFNCLFWNCPQQGNVCTVTCNVQLCISMSNKKRKEKASSVIWYLAPESHALVLSASSAQFCNLCLFSNWLDITTGLLHSTEHPWHSLDPGISRYYKVLEGTSRCLQTVQIDPFLFLHNNEARCL